MVPETRYAKSGDVRIAYQVVGNGPLDLIFVPGFISKPSATGEKATPGNGLGETLSRHDKARLTGRARTFRNVSAQRNPASTLDSLFPPEKATQTPVSHPGGASSFLAKMSKTIQPPSIEVPTAWSSSLTAPVTPREDHSTRSG